MMISVRKQTDSNKILSVYVFEAISRIVILFAWFHGIRLMLNLLTFLFPKIKLREGHTVTYVFERKIYSE